MTEQGKRAIQHIKNVLLGKSHIAYFRTRLPVSHEKEVPIKKVLKLCGNAGFDHTVVNEEDGGVFCASCNKEHRIPDL